MFNTIIGVSNFERFFLDEKYITEAKFQSLIIPNTIEFEKQKLNGTVSGRKFTIEPEHISEIDTFDHTRISNQTLNGTVSGPQILL